MNVYYALMWSACVAILGCVTGYTSSAFAAGDAEGPRATIMVYDASKCCGARLVWEPGTRHSGGNMRVVSAASSGENTLAFRHCGGGRLQTDGPIRQNAVTAFRGKAERLGRHQAFEGVCLLQSFGLT